MKRSVLSLLALLLSGLATASNSPREYGAAMAVDDLEGSWRLASLEAPGLTIHDEESVYVFHGRKFAALRNGTPVLYGTYKSDPLQQPGRLDRTVSNYPFEGQTTWKDIYRIEGDVLRIATRVNASEGRPNGFDGNHTAIITMKRIKQ